jgi:hypothetical protein
LEDNEQEHEHDANKRQQDKLQESMENQSVTSAISKKSQRSSSGAIIREVVEKEWEITGKDTKRNVLYKCKLCNKERIFNANRKVHACPKKK